MLTISVKVLDNASSSRRHHIMYSTQLSYLGQVRRSAHANLGTLAWLEPESRCILALISGAGPMFGYSTYCELERVHDNIEAPQYLKQSPLSQYY